MCRQRSGDRSQKFSRRISSVLRVTASLVTIVTLIAMIVVEVVTFDCFSTPSPFLDLLLVPSAQKIRASQITVVFSESDFRLTVFQHALLKISRPRAELDAPVPRVFSSFPRVDWLGFGGLSSSFGDGGAMILSLLDLTVIVALAVTVLRQVSPAARSAVWSLRDVICFLQLQRLGYGFGS
eukprot:TRINITY_DN13868_c0_g1_i3.p1 TRINITY_DN13868_c0_g1~~TRINITY_DN13868_c0_g1_i3.p1  ORF type:complete len:181 (-),score=18.21 TRINITY_DN13868_c0_g1_i3:59-601(-)